MNTAKESVRLVRAIMRSGRAQPLRDAGWTDAQLIKLLVVTVADLHPTDLGAIIRCVLGVDLPGAELVELDRLIYDDPDEDEDDDDDDEEDDDYSLNRLFDAAWVHLSFSEVCDTRGSAEYQRYLLAWCAAGQPDTVTEWIRAAVRQSDRAPSVDPTPAVDPTPDEIAAHEARECEG